ncbi:MAG: SMI1/KNR4 family protein [Planctomycetaceae bacterium]|nr:SMI1/KNR4 family protein [Planctomycetaceae bacterium]
MLHRSGWPLLELNRLIALRKLGRQRLMTDNFFPHSRIGLAARTLPDDARPIFAAASSADKIAELESVFGCNLQPAVRAFFETHDSISALDVHCGYYIGGIDMIIRSLQRGDYAPNLNGTAVFPIGSDGGGNAFLMPVGEDGPIWKWSHETGGTTQIADSFKVFLERLADDFRMYAAGNASWTFMAG